MKKNKNSSCKDIESFFRKTLGISINSETNLFGDLKLIGHDAELFIIAFSEEFNVDISNFKFSDYFVDDYSNPLLYWRDKLFRKEKFKRKALNIDHLLRVIDSGVWIDPEELL